MTAAGSVTSLHLYPVKSCRGVDLEAAVVERRGFALDRRFMVVDEDGWFRTQRATRELALVDVEVDDAAGVLRLAAGSRHVELELARAGDGRPVTASVWGHAAAAVDQGDEVATLLTDVVGEPSRLVFMPDSHRRLVNPRFAANPGVDVVGFADAYPMLLTSSASLADLQADMESHVPMDRFRANVVVDVGEPWGEDGWSQVQIGAARFHVAKECTRCVITTTDQRTAERGREPLATLAKRRRGPGGKVAFGVYLVPLDPGVTVRRGDPFEVIGRR